jgi:pimeloyl-ACP methyl ester carboxylesterase
VIGRAARALIGQAAAAVDRAATAAAYAQSRRARRRSAERLGHAERLDALARLALLYPANDGAFFREPRPCAMQTTPVRSLADGGRVVDMRWPSRYVPYLPDLAARYDRPENRHAGARMFLHPEPGPAAVLVHGYLSGHFGVEERTWPVRWFYEELGLDLALFVLPFHGCRAISGRRRAPPFPGSDPRMSNEGFRQAIDDARDLFAWLEARGCPATGIMGMSLGGYTTALAATVHPTLAFAVPVIPLASIADFAREQRRLGGTPAETELEHRALDAVHQVVSPLHRPPLVEPKRTLVIAAENDRITPIRHAQRLASHFGAELDTWPGGHLLQFGRGDAFRRIGVHLAGLGLVPGPRS